MIYSQKRDDGFFCHPILIVAKDDSNQTVEFYAITSAPPKAIQDLKMFLRLGDGTFEEGADTLKLAASSDAMPRTSFVNLEQRFTIEWEYLHEMRWDLDVNVDPEERTKLDFKISELEAQQNRCKLRFYHVS